MAPPMGLPGIDQDFVKSLVGHTELLFEPIPSTSYKNWGSKDVTR